MNKEMFDKLSHYNFKQADILYAHNLYPYTLDRTLLYGYTCARETFHVYIKDEQIYTVVYNTEYSRGVPKPVNMRQIEIKSNHDYVPDKRLYPERCDYHFCLLLKEKGIDLPFTVYTKEVEDTSQTYFGFTLEDL